MRSVTPHGRFVGEVFQELTLPNQPAVARVEAEHTLVSKDDRHRAFAGLVFGQLALHSVKHE
jgi:hypothetical protein